MPRNYKDITGKKYHKLKAIQMDHMQKMGDGRSRAWWVWQCECGNRIIRSLRNVRCGYIKSCGCHVRRGWQMVAWAVYYRNYNDGNLSFDEFIELSRQPCYYCGAVKTNTRKIKKNSWSYNGLDRLSNKKPHNKNNVVPACFFCNEHKCEMSYKEFMNWIEVIYFNRCLTENFNE